MIDRIMKISRQLEECAESIEILTKVNKDIYEGKRFDFDIATFDNPPEAIYDTTMQRFMGGENMQQEPVSAQFSAHNNPKFAMKVIGMAIESWKAKEARLKKELKDSFGEKS